MALLQSDASRAWKDELSCDLDLLRQEMVPQLEEVEGLPDLERLWLEHPKAWKQLVSSCQRKLVERHLRSEPSQPAPVPFLPTFSWDQCDDVHGKLRALRSHQVSAHQRRREAPLRPRFNLPRMQGGFPVEAEGNSASGGAKRCVLARKYSALEQYSDDAVAAADQLDCEHRRRCMLVGRSHLTGPPVMRRREGGE